MKNKEYILRALIGGVVGFLTYKILNFLIGKYV